MPRVVYGQFRFSLMNDVSGHRVRPDVIACQATISSPRWTRCFVVVQLYFFVSTSRRVSGILFVHMRWKYPKKGKESNDSETRRSIFCLDQITSSNDMEEEKNIVKVRRWRPYPSIMSCHLLDNGGRGRNWDEGYKFPWKVLPQKKIQFGMSNCGRVAIFSTFLYIGRKWMWKREKRGIWLATGHPSGAMSVDYLGRRVPIQPRQHRSSRLSTCGGIWVNTGGGTTNCT